MKSMFLLSVGVVLVLCAAPASTLAHHGQGAYGGKAVMLSGTVKNFEWTNPHCILTVAVKDENDNVADWYAEFLPPGQMSRNGWAKDVIKQGDEISMVGRPGKKGQHIMWIESLVIPGGRKLDREARVR